MSGSMKWMGAAAIIAALGTVAHGADLSPPSPPRHGPHGPLQHLPLRPPDHETVVAPAGDPRTSEHPGIATKEWGANSRFDGPPVRFYTDPSGVIGGNRFNSNHELDPNWLTGAGTQAR
jgi:hypothetical protein